MCQICNGTGGINIEHSWGVHFAPCPNSNCDYDREKAIQELDEEIARITKELDKLEGVAS